MRRPTPDETWPQSWRSSYAVDLQEIFGKVKDVGYVNAYSLRRSKATDAVTSVADPPARVLDVAAGQGNFTLYLAEHGYDVTWNDLRDDLAGYVGLKHEFGSVTYTPGNVFDLKFEHEFDVVLMTEIIEHVAHPDEFLSSAAKLVRPGGWIVMTTPNGAYWRNTLPRFSECPDPSVFEESQFQPDADGHIFLLHEDEVRSMACEADLRVDRIELFTNSLTAGHVKTAPLLKVIPPSLVEWFERRTQATGRWNLPSFRQRINAQMLVVLQRPAPEPVA